MGKHKRYRIGTVVKKDHLITGTPVEELRQLVSGKYRIDDSGCWIWIGSTTGRREYSYGIVYMKATAVIAKRVMVWLHRGDLGNGLHVCHRCDRPLCVNPDHLFLGTAEDNVRDAIAKGRFHQNTLTRRPRPDELVRGEQCHNAKLKAEFVRAIRARWAAGESMCGLARVFGVTDGAIRKVVFRRTWGHVA